MDDLVVTPHLLDLVFTCGAGTVGLLVAFNFLSTLSGAARRVTPENRRIAPAQVWLNVVPVFNLVWLPVTIDRLADSLRNEFYTRGLDDRGESFGRPLGLAWPVLFLLTWVFDLLTELPRHSTPIPALAGPLAVGCGVACFACWVGYWVQMSSYARRLKTRTYNPPAADPW